MYNAILSISQVFMLFNLLASYGDLFLLLCPSDRIPEQKLTKIKTFCSLPRLVYHK
jgi:hypothetical protein